MPVSRQAENQCSKPAVLEFACPLEALGKIFLNSSAQPFGEGNGTPLQYSCLENPMDGGAWYAAVHGVAEGRTRLSDFTFTFHFHALEKEMATHSSVLAWRIPGTGEPGGLPSMGSHRVRHDWSNLAAAATAAQPFPQIELEYLGFGPRHWCFLKALHIILCKMWLKIAAVS